MADFSGLSSALSDASIYNAAVSLGIIILLFPIILVLIDYAGVLSLRRRMPPGPLPLPLFGNYFSIPGERPWLKFEEWSVKTYKSPLITIWNGTAPTILCNDAWCISDLLDKRASIYSSRPRRLTHAIVGPQNVRTFRPSQSDEANLMLRDVLETPENMTDAIGRFACSQASIIGWGRRIDTVHDHLAALSIPATEAANFAIPGFYIIETLPFLTKLPAWLFKMPTELAAGSKLFGKYLWALTEEAGKANFENNFAQLLLQEKEKSGLTSNEIGSLIGNIVGGGLATMTSTTLSFILAMCVFPDVQRKAQAEIDNVVGDGHRLPTWEDESSMPYVAAVISEVFRWRPVTVLGGMAHAPIQDDVYKEYFIPKGTAIMGNSWAIHRNSRDYPDPEAFRPERFYDGLERPFPIKKGHYAFGWGRRACSGQNLAEQALWITIVRLLWAFNIQPGLDEKGVEVNLDTFAYTNTENSRPKPFKARFTPRSAKHKHTLLNEAAKSRDALHIFDWESKAKM
ncbi:O-methylsterigmatocystin oxidoreductase [Talaromyces islandicus]|uniref:O-methylsterigmatocystin oxidoreductase n=1 Tax=Talaromyces islandicus TaxID=28573 RepID=A0A0U1LIS9_TALIS|nr:O-methylsterigmatocystin oxidoreductase [Talaromyces islandicus]